MNFSANKSTVVSMHSYVYLGPLIFSKLIKNQLSTKLFELRMFSIKTYFQTY